MSRGPQGHRFRPLVQPPQAAVISVAHRPVYSDRRRSRERKLIRQAGRHAKPSEHHSITCGRAVRLERQLGLAYPTLEMQ